MSEQRTTRLILLVSCEDGDPHSSEVVRKLRYKPMPHSTASVWQPAPILHPSPHTLKTISAASAPDCPAFLSTNRPTYRDLYPIITAVAVAAAAMPTPHNSYLHCSSMLAALDVTQASPQTAASHCLSLPLTASHNEDLISDVITI